MAAEPIDVLTRRRALALAGAAGVGVLAAPGVALAGRGSSPSSRPRSFAMGVGAGAFVAGRTGVLRAPARFDLVGLAGRGSAAARAEVRVRSGGGRFGAWIPLAGGADHAPDRPRRNEASDPVWAGGSDELELRLRGTVPVGGVQLRFVSVPAGVGAREAASVRARPATGRAAQAAPTIIPRAAWGARAVPPRSRPDIGVVQMAFVHHTVSANAYTAADSAGIVLGIAKYHRDSNGWSDIGYNFLVDQFGQVFEGREGGIEAAVVGAQAQGWNSQSTGIATIGTFESAAFPEAGMRALAGLIAWKLALHSVPVAGQVVLRSPGGAQNRFRSGTDVTFQRVSGHRDGCATSCPGAALYGQLGDLRRRAAGIQPAVEPAPSGPAKLSAAAAAASATYGADAVFTGRLVDAAGAGVGGVPISIQKRGERAWTTLVKVTTTADGSWQARLAWRRSGQVRAAARADGIDVRSAAVVVAVGPLVELTRPAARVQQGRGVLLRGRVRPAQAVSVLVERQGSDGAWRRVGVVRLRQRDGRFAQRVTLASAGLHRLTVRAQQGGRTATAAPAYVRAVRRAQDVGASGSGGAATSPAMDPPSAPTGGSAATSSGVVGGASASRSRQPRR